MAADTEADSQFRLGEKACADRILPRNDFVGQFGRDRLRPRLQQNSTKPNMFERSAKCRR